MNIFKRIINRLSTNHKDLYVIADPSDNSITFSEKLFEVVRKEIVNKESTVEVMTFLRNGEYAFIVEPYDVISEETATARIQYNGKYKTIGFESLIPSVNMIMHNYGIMKLEKVTLSVRVKRNVKVGSGIKTIFIIKKPLEGD